MRLELLTPPELVSVHGAPALLLARRGDRCYVQLSRGSGANHLCWVADSALHDPGGPLPAPARGLPWARPRGDR